MKLTQTGSEAIGQRIGETISMEFVYLASASPRRRELLRQIGVPHRVIEAAVDESVLPGEEGVDYVARLARAKAEAGVRRRPAGALEPVLAADTAVVLDGRILGKPQGREDGARMLGALAGRTHRVLTAVVLAQGSECRLRLSESEVTFRPIDTAECRAYWDTGEPCDKAGGYAIQGLAAVFVSRLHGSFSGVVGLPLFETAQLLGEAGIPRWRRP
jgi:septum formation protein